MLIFLLLFSEAECYLIRVVMHPGKPGGPGKIRGLDISLKHQGKVRKFCHFIQNSGKVREFEKKLRLETIFIPNLKSNF